MNLAQLVALQAGGPGSGRHKESEDLRAVIRYNLREDFKKGISREAFQRKAEETADSMPQHFSKISDKAFNKMVDKAWNELKERYSDMTAGGEGSGCRGPNCGRPRTDFSKMKPEEREEYLRQQRAKTNWRPMTVKERALSLKERIKTAPGKSTDKDQAKIERQSRFIDKKLKEVIKQKDTKARQEKTSGKYITGPKGAKAPVQTPAKAPFYSPDEIKNMTGPVKIPKDSSDRIRVMQKPSDSTKDMRRWKESQPEFDKSIREFQHLDIVKSNSPAATLGDTVRTKVQTQGFDNDKMWYRNYKPGTKMQVVAVKGEVGNSNRLVKVETPHGDTIWMKPSEVDKVKPASEQLTVTNVPTRIGSNPQMVEVQRPNGDKTLIPATELKLHYANVPSIEQKTIRRDQYTKQVETPSGARYTQLIDKTPKEQTGRDYSKPPQSPHSLWGRFTPLVSKTGEPITNIRTFNLKALAPGKSIASVYEANYGARTPEQVKSGTHGATVVVERDMSNKKGPITAVKGRVTEFEHDQFGHIKHSSTPPLKFNSLNKMTSYLSSRYGINIKPSSRSKK